MLILNGSLIRGSLSVSRCEKRFDRKLALGKTQSAFFQRDEPATAYDNVVQQLHIQQLARLQDCPCNGNIIRAWRGVSGGWSRDRAHLSTLQLMCFPIPLPKPDMRLSPHPAFYCEFLPVLLRLLFVP